MEHIKRYYLNLLDKDKKNFIDVVLYDILYFLSFIYEFAVFTRNAGYDLKLFPAYYAKKRIISVGNISWGGAGKTSVVMYLHKKLSLHYRTVSVTKGYAQDEFLMLKDRLFDVFDAKDRVSLVKKLEGRFDVFILDDGFQYRKLKRDLDIVIVTEREFMKPGRLLPVYILREPVTSLKRAGIIVINYWHRVDDIDKIKNRILSINPGAKIYFADYVCKGFMNRENKHIDAGHFKNKNVGVLTAIGYPGGFIGMFYDLGINIGKELVYSDHYNFDAREIRKVENAFKKEGINDIIITYKDFYHLDLKEASLNYFIMEVDLKIEEDEDFLREVNKFIT